MLRGAILCYFSARASRKLAQASRESAHRETGDIAVFLSLPGDRLTVGMTLSPVTTLYRLAARFMDPNITAANSVALPSAGIGPIILFRIPHAERVSVISQAVLYLVSFPALIDIATYHFQLWILGSSVKCPIRSKGESSPHKRLLISSLSPSSSASPLLSLVPFSHHAAEFPRRLS